MSSQENFGRVLCSGLLALALGSGGCSSGGHGNPAAGTGGATNPAGTGGTTDPGIGGAGGATNPAGTGGATYPVGTGGVPSSGGMAGGAAGGSSGSGGRASHPSGGAAGGPPPSASEQAERDQIRTALLNVANLDSAQLAIRYPSPFAPGLSYDAASAKNVSLIEGSVLGLTAAEKQALGTNGFVISDRQKFPTFTYGYKSIYAADLPLFVSADSILYAVHRSYDGILEDIEQYSLISTLTSLLNGMREALGAGAIAPLGTDTAKDVDLYLAVALGLLTKTSPAPVAGAAATLVNQFVADATNAAGIEYVQLFGSTRPEDFSQFTPRGHYTDSPALSQYFQAMMWLGRFDMRMIDVGEDGSQWFDRRQFDAALALATLSAAGTNQSQWQVMDTALDLFVGSRTA